jgi:hypothetical protein
MRLIRMDKARESAPIVLNLIKDTGWCYTWGLVSVITIVPVLTFQVYEVWKARKEGLHKVMQNIAAMLAVMANGTWMVGDLYFHDHFRVFGRWIFAISFIFLGLYGILAYRLSKKKSEKAVDTQRVMTISKETRGIVFVHGRLPGIRKPGRYHHRVIMARPRARQ